VLKSDKEDQKGAQKVGGLLEVDGLMVQHIAHQEHTMSPKRSCYEIFQVVPDDLQRLAQALEHPSLRIGPQVATTPVPDDDEISVSSMLSLFAPCYYYDSSDNDSSDDEGASAPLQHDTTPEAMSNCTHPAQSSVQASRDSVRQVAATAQSMQDYMPAYGRLTIFDDD
jgi:hypothetical protein